VLKIENENRKYEENEKRTKSSSCNSDNDLILVVCDKFSKMLYFVVTTEKIIVEGLARLFRDNIWKLYGLPESVI